MRNFQCPECDHVFDTFQVDGYPVGDRVLEGVMFNVQKQDDGTWTAKVAEPDNSYVRGLNIPMWNQAVAEYVRDAADDEIAECPNPECDYGIVPETDEVK